MTDSYMYTDHPFWQALTRHLRAIDQWNSWKNWTDEKIVMQKYIRTRDEMAAIPMTADVDERTLFNIRLFHQALAQSLERQLNCFTSVVVDINHEGFGRALILTGSFVLHEKVYREAHRFHFSDIESMVQHAEKMRLSAIEAYEKYRDCITR